MQSTRRQLAALLGAALLLLTWGGAEGKDKGEASPRAWQLSVNGDRLSADIRQVPLREVLAELARQLPITVSVKGPVAKEPVATVFRDLPLEEGLRRILRGKEYALFRGTREADRQSPDEGQIREILVLSHRGAGTGQWTDFEGESLPSFEELRQQAFKASDPGDRVVALEVLVDIAKEGELVPILARALDDTDSGVREMALDLLEDTVDPLPQEKVARLALKDRNPKLRGKALTLLAYRDEQAAVGLLEQALRDPDIRVRNLAAEILDELDVLRPQENGQAGQ